MKRHVSHAKAWAVIGGVIIVAVLGVIVQYGDLIGARVFADIGQDYKPLVRHQISQKHCYDDGSDFCEGDANAFTKEFTLAYLLSKGKVPKGISAKPLYSCVSTKSSKFTAALDKSECSSKEGYNKKYLLGYLLETPDVEAATAVYECSGQDGEDTLLTDDPNECGLVQYGEPQLLGYAASAGNLPTRRLTELCSQVEKACTAFRGGANASMCGSHEGLCGL